MECSICGRKLKNPKSRELGCGAVCYRKAFGTVKTGKSTDNKKQFSVGKQPACEIPGQMLLTDYLQ